MNNEIGRELSAEELELVTGGSLVVDFSVDDPDVDPESAPESAGN